MGRTSGWVLFSILPGFFFALTTSHCRRLDPPSCRGEAFHRNQAPTVVGQVMQAHLGARPHDADRSHDPTARRVLLRSEHMLDASAYPALGVVHSFLELVRCEHHRLDRRAKALPRHEMINSFERFAPR